MIVLCNFTRLSTHDKLTPTNDPSTKSDISPVASRIAAPPANITNTAYETIEMSKAKSVPFGIDSAGFFKSPEILAPA